MAAAGRQPAPGVVGEILAEPRAFSFFQVVRLLERWTGTRLGQEKHAAEETLRVRPSPEFVFPRSGVEAVEDATGSDGRPRYRVTVSFLGLYGTTSPLPNFVTEEINFFEGDRDGARDVLDLLNHRLLSLFYRAWTKYRYDVRWEAGGADDISSKIFALCGLADEAVRGSVGVPDVRLLRYVGLLTQAPRSAAALRGILADYFADVPCGVEQCVFRWVWLERGDRWRLGAQNGRLGESATVGARVPDRAGQFRLVFGPMDLPTYESFLPPGERFAAATALARLVVRDNLAFDVEARLRHDEIPPLRLAPDRPPRLGWTSWLDRPAGDGVAVFRRHDGGTT